MHEKSREGALSSSVVTNLGQAYTDSERQLKESRRRDVVVIMILMLLGSQALNHLDSFSDFLSWLLSLQINEFDEFAAFLLLMPFGYLAFSVRRLRELRHHMRRRHQAEQTVYHQAVHDPLTGLHNRAYFNQRLDEAFASDDSQSLSVIILDLDDFKKINDLYGHTTGDQVLLALSQRLRRELRDQDVFARIGGDEFAIMPATRVAGEAAEVFAKRLLDSFSEPLDTGLQRFSVSVSLGIATAQPGTISITELMREADIAMYQVKRQGGGDYCVYHAALDEQLRDEQQLEQDLSQAVEQQSLELHYQPLYTADGKQLLSFEALLRWSHETRGMVGPDRFIPIAETSGLILPIGDWVLTQACREAARWPNDIKVAVNVSPLQFMRDGFYQKVEKALHDGGLAAERLEIEITEGVLMHDTEGAKATLSKLKQLGVQLSMDDFGTGYSSLYYLRQFPFDKLKLDRAFVSELENSDVDQTITRSAIELCHALGMRITAEGIETKGQLALLSELGCDQVQGYLLGRPAPAAKCWERFAERAA